jgi:hypothetical protein
MLWAVVYTWQTLGGQGSHFSQDRVTHFTGGDLAIALSHEVGGSKTLFKEV